MSVARLCDKGYEVIFRKNEATVYKDGKTVFAANRNGMLYEATFQVEKAFAGVADGDNQKLWHSRLAHLNVYDMKKLITNDMTFGLGKFSVNINEKFCEPCVSGKQCRLPFSKKNVIRSNRLLELIHTDVYGRVSESAWDGSNYFVSFTDDFSESLYNLLYRTKERSIRKIQRICGNGRVTTLHKGEEGGLHEGCQIACRQRGRIHFK